MMDNGAAYSAAIFSPESVPIVGYALDYWEGIVAEWNGFPNQTFMEEHNNILRAVKLGLGVENTRRQALHLALAAFPLVEKSSLWPVWLPLFEAVYHRFCDTDRALYGRFLGRLGQLYRLHNRLDEALTVHQEAAAIIAPLPTHSLPACEIAFQLAEDYRRKFQYDRAKQYALTAWEAATAARQSDTWRAAAANSLGLIYEALGQPDEAADWYTVSLGLWRPLQRPVESGRVFNNLGNVLRGQRKMDEALVAYHQALGHLAGTSIWLEKLVVQYNVAVIYFDQEQYEQAEKNFREAYAALSRQPDVHFILYASICYSLGAVIVKQERFAEAEPFFEESINVWRELGDDVSLANSLGGLADALAGQGKADNARQFYRQALALLANQRHIPRSEKLYQEFLAAYTSLNDGVEPVLR
ncbi:MAG: tetratricopeptide repeat protein [Chloroflexota bacterium]|jgi:tetratricopeptide (TPR) repeat protein